ncbi:MAG: nucleotidyltransferase domain-containing protein [Chloroflexi bacterium]|nr:nucleotidyltransferase domain-containing protein [Chloroflexota bacterium]
MSTIPILDINRRQRIPDAAIDDVVRQITEQFKPQKIILFGSYARQRPRPESDVDLLVIMDTPLTETEQAVRILQATNYHFGLDLLVRKPDNLNRRLELGDPFLQEIMREGLVVYERIDS